MIASTYPDGLEWSMEQVAGTTELETTGGIYILAEKIQSLTSLLPDYAWKYNESMTGTVFSGIFGGIVVIIVCTMICFLLKYFRKKSRERTKE